MPVLDDGWQSEPSWEGLSSYPPVFVSRAGHSIPLHRSILLLLFHTGWLCSHMNLMHVEVTTNLSFAFFLLGCVAVYADH